MDTYETILKNGQQPDVEKFGKNYNDILERFIKYLAPSEIETLKVLSCCKYWDFNIFDKLVTDFKTGFPITAFDELISFSFISPVNTADQKESFSLHEIMRAHLNKILNTKSKLKIHECLFNYFNELLGGDEVESIELGPSVLYLVSEATYHRKQIDQPVDFYKWLLKLSQKLYGHIASTSLQESLSKGLQQLSFEKDYYLLAKINQELARLNRWVNNYELVDLHIKNGLAIVKRALDEKYRGFPQEMIEKDPALIMVQADLNIELATLYHELDQNVRAYEEYLNAIKLGNKVGYGVDLGQFPNLLLELGRIPEAQGYFYRHLIDVLKSDDHTGLSYVYYNIGRIFFAQKAYQASLVYFKRALDIIENTKGTDHRDFWVAKRRYAKALFATGDVVKAVKSLPETKTWFETAYGKEHYEVGYVLMDFARCERALNDHSDAIRSLKQAIQLLIPKWGEKNTEVVTAQLLLCAIIQELPQINEAKIPDDEMERYMSDYNGYMAQFDKDFRRDFNVFLGNYGYTGELMELFFNVLEQHYQQRGEEEAISLLQKKSKEVSRVFRDQFRIRLLEGSERELLSAEKKKIFLASCNKQLGLLEGVTMDVYKSELPFFSETTIYHLVYPGAVTDYVIQSHDLIVLLDYSNAPIYTVAKKSFTLSKDTVEEYARFFLDAVKGRHGKFYYPVNTADIPLRVDLDISEEILSRIQNNTKPTEFVEILPEHITLSLDLFFKDSLFRVNYNIKADGEIIMNFEEQLVLEGLPIAVEPNFDTAFAKDDQLLLNAIDLFKQLLLKAEIDNEDRTALDRLLSNLDKFGDYKDAAEKLEHYLSAILTDVKPLIEKYVKPTYSSGIIYQKEVGNVLSDVEEILSDRNLHNMRKTFKTEIRAASLNILDEPVDETTAQTLAAASSSAGFAQPIQRISVSRLQFLASTELYTVYYEEDQVKYFLFNNGQFSYLDGSNTAIYAIAENNFIFSANTAKEYMEFFFNVVAGRHGHFNIVNDIADLHFNAEVTLTEEQKQDITDKISPFEITTVEDNCITLTGTILFKDALFHSGFLLEQNGHCSLFDQKIMMENLPVIHE